MRPIANIAHDFVRLSVITLALYAFFVTLNGAGHDLVDEPFMVDKTLLNNAKVGGYLSPMAPPSPFGPPIQTSRHHESSLSTLAPAWTSDRAFAASHTRNAVYSSNIPSFRLDVYHPIEEIYSFIDALAKKFPNRINVFTIGTTAERRPLKAVEVTNNVTDPDYVWLDALTHAREWITGSTMLYIMDKVSRKEVNKNFIFVPVVNPDGYSFTWTSDRMWRKNRSKHLKTTGVGNRLQQEKCIGTDLNRNFDLNFGGEGSSASPCSHIYRGPYAFSEEETKSVADLLWSLKDRIRLYLTLHSYNQLWACPYAHTTDSSPNLENHMRVLRAVQKAVYETDGVKYDIGPLSTSLYVGSGFGIDFAYEKCGIEHSYLAELRDRGQHGFILPPNQIMPTAMETWNGLKAAMSIVFV